MKLLFDQNISPKILKKLPEDFSESNQVRFIGLENAPDFKIFEFAKNKRFAVVSFDSDFVDMNALYGTPPKIIYLNTGNLTTNNVSALILENLSTIEDYLNDDTDDILELIKV